MVIKYFYVIGIIFQHIHLTLRWDLNRYYHTETE